MMKKKDFKAILEQFGHEYASMEHRIRDIIATKTEDELKDILEACKALTMTNCWYAIYLALPEVKTGCLLRLSALQKILEVR